MEAVFGFIGVIVGGIITTAASVGVEMVRARGDLRLDKEKRSDDRRLSHEQFQREALVGLQDAAIELLVATTRVYTVHKRRAQAGESWGGSVPSEIDSQAVQALVAVERMRSRIADDDLRACATRLTRACTGVVGAESSEAAEKALGNVRDIEGALTDQSGALLRATFRIGVT